MVLSVLTVSGAVKTLPVGTVAWEVPVGLAGESGLQPAQGTARGPCDQKEAREFNGSLFAPRPWTPSGYFSGRQIASNCSLFFLILFQVLRSPFKDICKKGKRGRGRKVIGEKPIMIIRNATCIQPCDGAGDPVWGQRLHANCRVQATFLFGEVRSHRFLP